jgi:hypothetical protein
MTVLDRPPRPGPLRRPAAGRTSLVLAAALALVDGTRTDTGDPSRRDRGNSGHEAGNPDPGVLLLSPRRVDRPTPCGTPSRSPAAPHRIRVATPAAHGLRDRACRRCRRRAARTPPWSPVPTRTPCCANSSISPHRLGPGRRRHHPAAARIPHRAAGRDHPGHRARPGAGRPRGPRRAAARQGRLVRRRRAAARVPRRARPRGRRRPGRRAPPGLGSPGAARCRTPSTAAAPAPAAPCRPRRRRPGPHGRRLRARPGPGTRRDPPCCWPSCPDESVDTFRGALPDAATRITDRTGRGRSRRVRLRGRRYRGSGRPRARGLDAVRARLPLAGAGSDLATTRAGRSPRGPDPDGTVRSATVGTATRAEADAGTPSAPTTCGRSRS